MDEVDHRPARGGVQRWILHRFLSWLGGSVVVDGYLFDLTEETDRNELIDRWAATTPPEWR